MDPRRGRWVLGCADHGVLCNDPGADLACAYSGADTHTDIRGMGDDRFRAEHPGVHLHWPADPPDYREPAGKRSRPLSRCSRRRPPDRDRRAPRLAYVVQYCDPLATAPDWFPSAAANAAPNARQWFDHLMGRDARDSLSRRGHGAPGGI